MKIILTWIFTGLLGVASLHAQDHLKALKIREIHLANSMGWGIPVGQTSQILRAKYSTNLGLDIGLQDKRYFLFPSIDFLSFKFNQAIPDPAYPYQIKNGNSYFYLLNLAAGRRIQWNKFAIHAYLGPGAGMVTEPRAMVDADQVVHLKNKYYFTGSVRLGSGAHYQLGNVRLFADVSYLHNFRETQGASTQVLTIYGGIRTNITQVADRVIEIINN